MKTLINEIFYWMAWLIIPVLVEILPNMLYFCVLLWKKAMIVKKEKPLGDFKPVITLMIPVYNSAGTLYRCIKSVYHSTYDSELIEILLVDNGSTDSSFAEFQRAQMDFVNLRMWWMTSRQGKSKALNKAIFNSNGKYIINIDSDGILHEKALENMVRRFENHPDIDSMTGVILTEPALIEKTKRFMLKRFQIMEFVEYAQAFLAGRNFETQFHSVYTLSGAFSAFRKSVLLKTFLYNSNTICEDTHLSFQIKTILKKKVLFCHDALFMVDPIESINKFYTQRQRWQIGELEVSNMFLKSHLKAPLFHMVKDFNMRVLIQDHTFAFPRLLWYFVILILGALTHNFKKVLIASLLIICFYDVAAFLYYLSILSFLTPFPEVKKYYKSKLFYVLMLPLYNIFVFIIRHAGIVNSIERKSAWKTKTFTEETKEISDTLHMDWKFLVRFRAWVSKLIEYPEDENVL